MALVVDIINPGNSGQAIPLPHKASHQNNGSDELSVAGLSGLLADAQTPLGHQHGGGDISSPVSEAVNADTLDGVHAGSLMSKYTSNNTIAAGGNALFPAFESTGSAAGFSLYRPGLYAVNFGLDTDDKLKVGGWSMGNVSHEIWHDGNRPGGRVYVPYAPLATHNSYGGGWVGGDAVISLLSGWNYFNTPSNAKAVMIKLSYQCAVAGQSCAIGYDLTNCWYVHCRSQVANLWIDNTGITPITDSGNIYLRLTYGGNVFISILGYFF